MGFPGEGGKKVSSVEMKNIRTDLVHLVPLQHRHKFHTIGVIVLVQPIAGPVKFGVAHHMQPRDFELRCGQ